MAVRTIPAGEFKAKCLKLMDEVAATGDTLVITKRGKPVARVSAARPQSLLGMHKGRIRIVGDVVSPLPEEDWALSELEPSR